MNSHEQGNGVDRSMVVRVTEAPREQAARLEQEIHEIRANLGGKVTELGQRRNRLGRYLWPAVGVVGLAGAIAVTILLRRPPSHHAWFGRGQTLRRALRLAVQDPARVAAGRPGIGKRALGAAIAAASAMLARRLVSRLFARGSE